MLRVAVCDDNCKITEAVSTLIREWDAGIQVDAFASGEALLESYLPYKVIFLDIDMTGMNGIETGMRIRELDKAVKLVYLTAYSDYVSGAFQVHAFQYLMKPVKGEEIRQILKEAFEYLQKPERVVLDFQTNKGLMCLSADEILYFEYAQRKVHIVTLSGVYTMQEKIGNVVKRMGPYGFSMPHQSFVVNMLHVKNVLTGQILLDNSTEIPLAQKKQRAWKQELISYLSERVEGGRQ